LPRVGRNDPCSCGSGRKYKKCCLAKDVPSQSHAPTLPIHMDDLPTAKLKAFHARYFDQADALANRLSKQALAGNSTILVPRATWEGIEASEQLKVLMNRMECGLRDIASKHTRIYWLMLLRRLGPADFYAYDKPTTGNNSQRTAELAAVKYGRDGLDDLGGSVVARHSLPADQVTEDSLPDEASFGEIWAKAQSSMAYPRMELDDFYDYIALCVMARDYYSLTATFRKVGKGAKLVVTNNHDVEAVGAHIP